MRLFGCATLAVLAGCFAPAAPAGAPCAPGQRCPDGLVCTATPGGDVCLPPGGGGGSDAPAGGSDGSDGSCVDKVLLVGGMDVEKQGWQITRSGGATITYAPGVTELKTASAIGGSYQLIALPNAVAADKFSIELDVQIVAAGGHTDSNASVALMGSFHAPFGSDADRARMLFLDIDAVGFGAGGAKIGLDTTVARTYRVERSAEGKIVAQVIGSFKMSTGPYDTNGTIAIGDQTTAAGLDSTIRITQIRRSCP